MSANEPKQESAMHAQPQIGVIGAMQLRNDDRLSEESFLKLMIESYKRLPLLRGDGS